MWQLKVGQQYFPWKWNFLKAHLFPARFLRSQEATKGKKDADRTLQTKKTLTNYQLTINPINQLGPFLWLPPSSSSHHWLMAPSIMFFFSRDKKTQKVMNKLMHHIWKEVILNLFITPTRGVQIQLSHHQQKPPKTNNLHKPCWCYLHIPLI